MIEARTGGKTPQLAWESHSVQRRAHNQQLLAFQRPNSVEAAPSSETSKLSTVAAEAMQEQEPPQLSHNAVLLSGRPAHQGHENSQHLCTRFDWLAEKLQQRSSRPLRRLWSRHAKVLPPRLHLQVRNNSERGTAV